MFQSMPHPALARVSNLARFVCADRVFASAKAALGVDAHRIS
jgi:hypothetical protein